MDIIDEIKKFYKSSNTVMRLISINVGVFLIYQIIRLFFFLFAASDHFSLYYWLAAPTNLEVLLVRPWTLFTYMFFHVDLLHLFFNMLCLFWFGRLFGLYFNGRQMVNVYILSGITGVLFFIISYNVFPVFAAEKYGATICGASAGVLGIILAIACYVPRYTVNLFFVLKIKLIYIALATVLIDIVYISISDNAGGRISHLGGAFMGYLFASGVHKGKDITGWFSRICVRIGNWFKPKPKMKVHYTKPPADDREYNYQKHANQAEIDHILDKISKGGYDSLTKKEKEILFKQK